MKAGKDHRRPGTAPARENEPSSEEAGEWGEEQLGEPSAHEVDALEEEALAPQRGPPLASSETGIIPAPYAGPLDSMQRYMRDVERHPLLTREEEHELAVRLRETGDPEAALKLVTSNLRLVVKIAHDYHRAAYSMLDLVQEGNVGLMQAVKKYDPYRGVKLSSYAAWWIRAYILRFILENARLVKLGTTQAQRKLFFNLRKEQQKLAAQGFEVTPLLLAERLDVSEQEVQDMDQRLSQDEFSLDLPVGDMDKGSRADRLVSQQEPVDEQLAETELQEIVRTKMAEFGARLEGKERYIFEHRMAALEPMTLQQIGDHFGLTRERARQIEAKLAREFKEFIQAEVPDLKRLEVGYRDE